MKKLACSIAAAATVLASASALALGPGPAVRAYPEGFITGTVTSSNGPEAGVWVIAETHETNTPYIKIVVTDDEGRYALPQLPEATFNVWVRGYGLVDSAKVEGRPGDTELNLTAVIAPTPQDAAKVFPGDYWLSLLEVPGADMFPGTGPVAAGGNGYLPGVTSQDDWMHAFKKDCNFCHQLGNQLTRSLDHMDAPMKKPGSIAPRLACAGAACRASSSRSAWMAWPKRWQTGPVKWNPAQCRLRHHVRTASNRMLSSRCGTSVARRTSCTTSSPLTRTTPA